MMQYMQYVPTPLSKLFSHLHPIRKFFFWTKQSQKPFDIVRPGSVSAVRTTPAEIARPSYVTEGVYPKLEEIVVKNFTEVEGVRRASQLAKKILNLASSLAKVGVTTDEIDILVHEACVNNRCYPSPLLYKGFPKSVCTSVNNIAVHGIPDNRQLKNGDIINIDVTVYLDGFHGDCSETYAVGEVDEKGEQLIRMARRCRDEAIEICQPGMNFAEIGKKISSILRGTSFQVLPQLCGHGIGKHFHEPPDVIHCDNFPNEKEIMKPGMIFTVEPCISEGDAEYKILGDGWTAAMVDNSRTAQFEHTVLITKNGVEILTTL